MVPKMQLFLPLPKYVLTTVSFGGILVRAQPRLGAWGVLSEYLLDESGGRMWHFSDILGMELSCHH